jgi:hypothetical protein
MRFKILTLLFFLSGFLLAQENKFVEWPFLRDICTVDTNCTHYQKDHISATTDSIFKGNVLSSIETRKYDAKGDLVCISFLRKDTSAPSTELLCYGIDAERKIIKATISTITGQDTFQFYRCDVLKYDKQYRPFQLHYQTKPTPGTAVEKQFTDDRLIFKYSGTLAAIHWSNSYGTDNFVKNTYGLIAYPWIQEQVCLHEKDTLYRRVNYYNKKFNIIKCETVIWPNDSVKTETIVDSLYNITETITWIRGKVSEHHFYTTQYVGKTIEKISIMNAMLVPQVRQYTIEYLGDETIVTPENGEPIHIAKKLEETPLFAPPPADPPAITYKTRKIEGDLIRYDYFNFKFSTSPLLSMWFNDKGVMVKSVTGNVVTNRSYEYGK